MTKFFDIIFCKIYQWVRALNADDIPQYTALSLYSIFLSLNILSLIGYAYYFIKGESVPSYPKLYMLALVAIVMAVLYLYFLKNRRYIELNKKYSTTILNNPVTGMLAIMYIVVSILLFVGLIWLT